MTTAERVARIRGAMPEGGLFRGKEWVVSPRPFPLSPELSARLQELGPALLAFQRACNELYHRSAAGDQPWVARLLDQGKPERMIALGRRPRWRDALPRVIRPDLMLGETGWAIAELDSLPGGIGLTGWLGETHAALGADILGGASGMIDGFARAFPGHDILVSRESADYQPEMDWLVHRLNAREHGTREVLNPWGVEPHALAGRSLYRFFELWDIGQVEHGNAILAMAERGELSLTPPPKAFLEEKLWLALFWSPALRDYWAGTLQPEHLSLLRASIPYGWVLDPTPLPVHAEWPQLGVRDWREMKSFGHRERELVVKVSGFSDQAWGSRGVNVGHDLSHDDWSAVIDHALDSFPRQPHLMQRFARARVVAHPVWDDAAQSERIMQARVRLCPYYFICDGEAVLGGVLATIVPADKKLLHGMTDAAMAPCSPT